MTRGNVPGETLGPNALHPWRTFPDRSVWGKNKCLTGGKLRVAGYVVKRSCWGPSWLEIFACEQRDRNLFKGITLREKNSSNGCRPYSRGVRKHNQYSHSLPFPLVNSHSHSQSRVLIFLFPFPFNFCYMGPMGIPVSRTLPEYSKEIWLCDWIVFDGVGARLTWWKIDC